MPSMDGVEVEIYAPGDENDKRNREEVHDALENSDWADEPLAETATGYVETLTTRDGKLVLGAWTGDENGEGWYVDVKIPLRPTESLQRFLSDLSETLASFSERFSVEKLRRAPVDADGRVSVGKEYAGAEKRVAVLEDES